jgi:hypothetical protein
MRQRNDDLIQIELEGVEVLGGQLFEPRCMKLSPTCELRSRSPRA